MVEIKKACPICGGDDIRPFNGRPNAKCGGCGSVERTRYMFLLLNRMGLISPKKSVLHFGPEPGMFHRLSRLCSDYTAADFDTSQYKLWSPKVEFIDLCNIPNVFDREYDLIIHNHVLEHVPCQVPAVIANLTRRLTPNGAMLFSVPIRANSGTMEDMDPSLSNEERKRQFGQWDHMRIFGEHDVLEALQGDEKFTLSAIAPKDYLSEHEIQCGFVPPLGDNLTGATIFMVTKAGN